MNRIVASLALLILPAATSAVAQSAPPAPPVRPSPAASDSKEAQGGAQNGRFTMTPAGDGFLRLDTRSGAVSFCTVKDGAAQCRSSADERGALEAEVGRLAAENSRLRGAGAGKGAPAVPQTLSSSLPSDAEVDRAIGLLDKIVRGTIRIMKEVESAPSN